MFPTAHTLVGDDSDTPHRTDGFGLGLTTLVQVLPFQRRVVAVCFRYPTAHASLPFEVTLINSLDGGEGTAFAVPLQALVLPIDPVAFRVRVVATFVESDAATARLWDATTAASVATSAPVQRAHAANNRTRFWKYPISAIPFP
jgi:hypothetical protein